jgi:hypothetical protein
MTDNEKQIYKKMVDEFGAAVLANEEHHNLSSPSAFCESVERIALKSAVLAFQTWMLTRGLAHSVRTAEGA